MKKKNDPRRLEREIRIAEDHWNDELAKKILKVIEEYKSESSRYFKIEKIIKEEKIRIIFLYLLGKKDFELSQKEKEVFGEFQKFVEEQLDTCHCLAIDRCRTPFKKFNEKFKLEIENREIIVVNRFLDEGFFFFEDFQGGKVIINWKDINPILDF